MKKILAFILCLTTLIASLALTSYALNVDISQGKDALIAQWDMGESHGFDYRAYSPVKDEEDTVKYPLVVMLHGKYSGSTEGEQLISSDFFNWSSIEYQSRFEESGGAFLLMPRTPGGDGKTWSNTSFHSGLMDLINDYIAANSDNIDTSRIYLLGWSMGGAGAISVASTYSNFFAALVIMAPFGSVTNAQLQSLKNTPIWLVTCTKDTTASYITFAKPFWNGLKDTTEIPSHCRITTFNKYNYYDTGHHNVQHAVAFDLLQQPSDCGMKTETAKGETIITSEGESIITWLSSYRLGEAKEDDFVCHCNCHASKGWTKFWWSISRFFYMIFSPGKKMCACGEAHW